MDTEKNDLANAATPQNEEEIVAVRAVAFPGEDNTHEDRPRPKGVEMKRSMTQEARELAAAGYEHLEEQKAKQSTDAADLTHVDIQEHHLPFVALEETLQTSVDTKDAANSLGLSEEEAKARLERNGRNVLTPPKKKSALRKVRNCQCYSCILR